MVHNLLTQPQYSWDDGKERRDPLGSQHISSHHGAETDEQRRTGKPSASRYRGVGGYRLREEIKCLIFACVSTGEGWSGGGGVGKAKDVAILCHTDLWRKFDFAPHKLKSILH